MIREISKNDIATCVNVIKQSFLTVANDLGFTVDNAPRFTAFSMTEDKLLYQLENEHRPMYAYFDNNNNIIGYYSLALQENKECELNNLCVLPQHRHNHIGGILLEDALTRAIQMGCGKMNIGIVEENKKLRHWYEDKGFIHTGTRKFDFFPFTCGYMTKDL